MTHYNCNYLPHTTLFGLYLIDLQLNTYSPSKVFAFTAKSPSVTQRQVSQENALKKSKKPSLKTTGLNNSSTLIENNFMFF